MVLLIGVAGFFGAIARYGLEGFITSRSVSAFPWRTFVVNISGSLLLGILFAVLVEGRVIVSPAVRTAVMVGFIGAYTTFSTLTLETFRLLEDGSFLLAGVNALGSFAVGVAAVYVGVVFGRLV
jgi:CrcB protein